VVKKVASYQFSNRLKKQYRSLPQEIQAAFGGKLELLLKNMQHPSLRVKRIQGTQDRWEGSITMKYRFTFDMSGNHMIFRAIGTHDILNR
jgi:mRNA-degrading endonuclease RelE of RelBE toxin-antitoxin system